MYYDLSEIISKSLKLAWKHKILWVLALMLTAGGSFRSGGGSGGGGNSSSDYSPQDNNRVEQNYDNYYKYNTQRKTTFNNAPLGKAFASLGTVLGTSTVFKDTAYVPTPEENAQYYLNSTVNSVLSNEFPSPESSNDGLMIYDNKYNEASDYMYPLNNSKINPTAPAYNPVKTLLEDLKSFFISVSPLIYILVGVSFLVFLGFSVGVGVFVKSWATGAFLNGINDAIGEKDYNLYTLGTYGRLSTKKILKYKLFLALVGTVFGISVLGFVLAFGLRFLLDKPNIFVAIFGAVLALMIPLIFVLFIIGMVEEFSLRFMTLRNMDIIKSIKSGLRLLTRNIGKYFVLAISNCFVVSVFGILSLLIMGSVVMSLIAGGSLLENLDNTAIILTLTVLAIPLIFASIAAFVALGGFLNTYKSFTWGMFFNFATMTDSLKIATAPVNINPTRNEQNNVESQINPTESISTASSIEITEDESGGSVPSEATAALFTEKYSDNIEKGVENARN